MGYKDKKYLSVREAAQLLCVSRMHVTRLIRAGKIPAEKVGRAYVIKRDDIGGIFRKISPTEKSIVEAAVRRTLREYKDVIRKLGKE